MIFPSRNIREYKLRRLASRLPKCQSGLVALTLLAVLLTGCQNQVQPNTLEPSDSHTAVSISTQTPILPTLTATPDPTFTAIPSQTSTPEPAGCLKPPEDYTRGEVNGVTINKRTLEMLTHAQELYGGELEISGDAITQGSYNASVDASFGTHSGGGAVDLSVLRRDTYTVLWDDIEPLIRALRVAGFAAWLRDYGELYSDSPIHIHAIAVGDRELSEPAQDQLTGESGYFRGYTGLPVASYGGPFIDRHNGPILCQWMIDLGYRDLR